MSKPIFTRDAGVSAFEDAGGPASTDDDGVSFSWDEEHVVRVDAPADLEGAFDTNQFYKIEGATIARPIKQPYLVGDDIEWYKKPADELRDAAWSFDNAPFTLTHPDTGMVKDVNDVHGFWRNVHYDSDEDRLRGDLYVPTADTEALDFIEDNQDVSPGFYNRVLSQYDGDTGDLTDDDVDGFQADMFGDHIAGVEQGRCSGSDGCGLNHDSEQHGEMITVDESVPTTDAPSGIYVADDGTWLAVGPDEHPDDNTEHPDDGKFPVDSCADVDDAWQLRGHTDGIDISESTLANRIERVDEAKGCGVVPDESQDATDCGCGNTTDTTMGDDNDNDFDLPDLSVDALAEKNEAVSELVAERDSLTETVDEMEQTITEAFDQADHFSVELDEDECPCEAVADLVEDLDSKVDQVEDLRDELDEYREEDINEKLDTLEDLGADRDAWADKADEADDPLEALDEEIERREEVLEAADAEMSVKDIDESTDEDDTQSTSTSGPRKFDRGYGA
jgi:hypothetical protein